MKTRFKCIKRHKKNAEIIKNKRNPRQKELLNLFNDLLYTILTNKTLKLESQKNENENENEIENENENDKTFMQSKDDIENEN